MAHIYSTHRWRSARSRAIERDSGRCTVSRLLGGDCAPGPLHVHHIVAVSEGGDPFDLDNLGTACSTHHGLWEPLRRQLVKRLVDQPPRCRHHHASREAREICERRLARQRGVAA